MIIYLIIYSSKSCNKFNIFVTIQKSKEEIMETKQDKIITFISALLAAVILVVVIACNVGNDSSKTDALENQSEKGNGN